jgi:hypothetical protein
MSIMERVTPAAGREGEGGALSVWGIDPRI